MTCSRARVDAHFRGGGGVDAERALRSHLAECGDCRAYYDRHLVLAALDPGAKPAEERLAAGLGLRARSGRTPMILGWAAACAAALVLFAMPWRRSEEYAARGGARHEEAQIFAYRVTPRGRLADGDVIGRADALAFAYSNAQSEDHLLVFGVDEHHHVYWYYPAWTDAAEDPRAIVIDRGATMRELPQAVRHDLDGTTLTLHAVFTHEAPSVRAIEARVARGDGAAPGEIERQITLRVEP